MSRPRVHRCPCCGEPSTPWQRWRNGKLLPLPITRCVYSGVLSRGGTGYSCRKDAAEREAARMDAEAATGQAVPS